MTREAPIVRQIQLAASVFGSRLFRNTVAKAVLGKAERVQRDGAVFLRTGDIVVRQGRVSMVGLALGSADCVGWKTITITPDMIGKQVAQFLSIECKKPGKSHTSEEQKNWLKVTTEAGACSGIVKSIVEAEALLRSKL